MTLRPYAALPLVLAILTLLGAGCEVSFRREGGATPTLYIITATLPPTFTPRPTSTPLPPTFPPTVAPVEGTTTTQVNVRSGPNTASPAVGILNIFTKVQIVGKDASGNWWQIIYLDGPEGRGWVTAEYIHTVGTPDVPVIGASGGEAAASSTGLVIQKINVRSGPGTDYDSLGMLNPNDVVTLSGKNEAATWLQIEFAAGAQGKGWITAGYVQARGVENLPIVTESGAVIGTGTPTVIPPTPTPTLAAAPADGDTLESPAIRVTFSPSAARAFDYTSDVSSPEGDAEDWVQFTPYASTAGQTAMLYINLACLGNGALSVELWWNNQPLQGWGSLACGESGRPLTLTGGQTYLFRLRAEESSGGLRYVNYTLTVQAAP